MHQNHSFQTEPCGCVTLNFTGTHTPASILFDGFLIEAGRHCDRAHFAPNHITPENVEIFLPLFRAAYQLEQLTNLLATIQKGAAHVCTF